MPMALVNLERGAEVRLVYDKDGGELKVQPLGIITRVKYQNKPDHIWTAQGIQSDEHGPCVWVQFAEGDVRQVAPAQLVLHKKADHRAMQALKDRKADADAHDVLMDAFAKPVKTDAMRLDAKALATKEREVKK